MRSPQKSCLSNNSFHQFSRAQPINWFDFYVSFLHRRRFNCVISLCRTFFFLIAAVSIDWVWRIVGKISCVTQRLWTLLCSVKSAWFLLPSMIVHSSAIYWLFPQLQLLWSPSEDSTTFLWSAHAIFTAAIKTLKAKWPFMTTSNRKNVWPPQICFPSPTMDKK